MNSVSFAKRPVTKPQIPFWEFCRKQWPSGRKLCSAHLYIKAGLRLKRMVKSLNSQHGGFGNALPDPTSMKETTLYDSDPIKICFLAHNIIYLGKCTMCH